MAIAMPRVVCALFALVCFATACFADEEPVDVPCGPLAQLPHREKYRAMTRDEFTAARAVFFSAQGTPLALPPGDHGLIEVAEDGSAYLVFVDHEEACALIHVTKDFAGLFEQIRKGVITHPPGKL